MAVVNYIVVEINPSDGMPVGPARGAATLAAAQNVAKSMIDQKPTAKVAAYGSAASLTATLTYAVETEPAP